MRHRSVVRSLVIGVMGVCALGVAYVGVGVPASAHADLVSSDPIDGATVSAPPSAITLTFSDPLFVDGVQMSLVTAAGAVVPTDPPTVAGATASLSWPTAAGPGSYEVGYRVVSADGHPISGAISFTIEQAAVPAATPEPSPTNVPLEPSASATDTTGSTTPSTPLMLGVALLAALAVAIVGALAFGRRKR